MKRIFILASLLGSITVFSAGYLLAGRAAAQQQPITFVPDPVELARVSRGVRVPVVVEGAIRLETDPKQPVPVQISQTKPIEVTGEVKMPPASLPPVEVWTAKGAVKVKCFRVPQIGEEVSLNETPTEWKVLKVQHVIHRDGVVLLVGEEGIVPKTAEGAKE